MPSGLKPARAAYYERFGEHPSDEDRLWQIDPITRLDFVCNVEFLETPSDLIERGAEILILEGVR